MRLEVLSDRLIEMLFYHIRALLPTQLLIPLLLASFGFFQRQVHLKDWVILISTFQTQGAKSELF